MSASECKKDIVFCKNDAIVDIFDTLISISKAIEWPQYYVEDLTKHDRAAILTMLPGEKWLWMVRKCGTEMFRLSPRKGDPTGDRRESWESCAVRYWLPQAVPFLINVDSHQRGRIQQITDAVTEKLAQKYLDGVLRYPIYDEEYLKEVTTVVHW